jgi:3-oxoacyl-[acyl-carrier-protein] synthase III
MSGNTRFVHSNTAVLSVVALEAPEVVLSSWFDEQLASTFERCGVRPGLLEQLAGVRSRRWWPRGTRFDAVAADAGEWALAEAGVDRSQVGVVISTSVSKHHLEPSVACAVHHRLRLPSSCLNFDLGNACLGFVNAMSVAASFIDSGQVEFVLIVDAEDCRLLQESTVQRLSGAYVSVSDVFDDFASLTLGSGAAAMVLGRADRHHDGHRVVGGVARAATEHHELCVGVLDRMSTDTRRLLTAGLDLAADTWGEACDVFGWGSGVDRFIIHQVSSVHTSALCERLGVDSSRVPLTFPTFGNIGPASIPFTLASAQQLLLPGQRVLLMGIGSGLNTAFTELVW